MKGIKAVVLVVASLLLSQVALAESKIGVVDLQKIMRTAPQMKQIQSKLEKDFKPRRDKLIATEASIKQNMEKFKRDNAIMSAEQKKSLEKEIITAQQNFERDGQKYQQELNTAHNEAMEDFYNKIRGAIAKVAKAESYDIILQKDAAPFSSEKLDVTNKVLKEVL